MTQAFNLSQLANNLNTAGQLDATDGLTGAVPVANGGTGQTTYSNGQLLIGNGTGLTKANITAGSGISVTNGSGTITIATSGGGVTSLNGQTGAVVTTDFGAIGSCAVLMNGANSDIGQGSTVAGSSLRYNNGITTYLVYSTCPTRFSGSNQSVGSSSYNGGGTSLSGTWRKMCNSQVYRAENTPKGTIVYYWTHGLYVRIS